MEIDHYHERRDIHRRSEDRRNLTDADIKALFEHFESNHYKYCQFRDIVDPADLRASVEFYRALTDSINGTKRTIWKTVLTIVIGGLSIITLRGIASWFKEIVR